MTFWRDTRTPFRSDTGLTDAPATPNRALGAIRDRPSRPIPCRGQAAAVRVSGSNGLRRASSPFPDLPCSSASEHELDAFRPTSASHCFDYEYSRLFRSQHLSRLTSRSLPWSAPREKRLGDPALHGAKDPLRRAARVRAWRFLPRTPDHAVPLTSLSLHRSVASRAFAREANLR